MTLRYKRSVAIIAVFGLLRMYWRAAIGQVREEEEEEAEAEAAAEAVDPKKEEEKFPILTCPSFARRSLIGRTPSENRITGASAS